MAQRQHQPPKQGRQVPYDRKQRQGVVGEACDTGISSAPASREFFITYVTKECDEAKMKQHINSHGITERNLTLREGNDYNSFVLKVSVGDVDKVRNPAMWPQGIYVRKFYTNKNK